METHPGWRLRDRAIHVGTRTVFMAVLNVTPDSFSDGNKWFEPDTAVEHGLAMLEEGADIVDIGGESTRPGATPVPAAEEQRRVLPVIRGILRRQRAAVLSVDTYHAETARLALEAGAEIVNDVSGGLWDPAMRPLWAASRCGVVLMHTRGRPQDWRNQPPLPPGAVVPLVAQELRVRAAQALAAGVAPEAIVLDPGFGFGKILDENFPLLGGLGEIVALGFPVAVGLSRKGFLKKIVARSEPQFGAPDASEGQALLDATTAAHTAAVLAGAHILRVHDVPAARRAAAVAEHIRATSPRPLPNFAPATPIP